MRAGCDVRAGCDQTTGGITSSCSSDRSQSSALESKDDSISQTSLGYLKALLFRANLPNNLYFLHDLREGLRLNRKPCERTNCKELLGASLKCGERKWRKSRSRSEDQCFRRLEIRDRRSITSRVRMVDEIEDREGLLEALERCLRHRVNHAWGR